MWNWEKAVITGRLALLMSCLLESWASLTNKNVPVQGLFISIQYWVFLYFLFSKILKQPSSTLMTFFYFFIKKRRSSTLFSSLTLKDIFEKHTSGLFFCLLLSQGFSLPLLQLLNANDSEDCSVLSSLFLPTPCVPLPLGITNVCLGVWTPWFAVLNNRFP